MWGDRLSLFVGYLIEMGRRPATVKSYISAIKAVLWVNQIPLFQDQSLLSALTRACRYQCNGVTLRMPLRRDMVNLLLEKIEQIFMQKGQTYLATLYLAMFSTYYYGLFRIGELVSGPHTILAHDTHIGMNKKKIMFLLRTSKTHWDDEVPQSVKISSSNRSKRSKLTYCPYELLRNYLLLQHKM